MDINLIKEKLRFLQDNPNKLNKITPKEFFLNPPIPESEVFYIERNLRIRFPENYRGFITKIGNGCSGPNYGLLSLEESMIDFKLKTKPAIDLTMPFSYSESWNEDWVFDIDWESGERPDENQLNSYMDTGHIHGCLQICHIGHGCTYLLVVNGIEYGNIWTDERPDYGGITPLLDTNGLRVSFEDWYTNWLKEVI
ncbi:MULTISPECIES: hypothetical protein [Sphingobacterium]|uniref:hypothetical protein n=1 Tax=Sphingobacterium TaxID=28453 RepID=UPI0025809AA3|nr:MULTISPECIES: hypothetical protein [Sphingobacterium]